MMICSIDIKRYDILLSDNYFVIVDVVKQIINWKMIFKLNFSGKIECNIIKESYFYNNINILL